MLIVDSVVAPRLKAGNKREKHDDQIRNWVTEQLAGAIYLEDNDLSPANAERQLGQKFFSNEFEARLKKLNSNLLWETNPFNTTKKALFHIRHGQGKVYICAYENGVMPERSIIRVKEEMVRDTSVGMPGGPKLDRKDLPKHEWTGAEKGFVFDDTVAPLGWKKVKIPYGEFKRGWRTVLARLVQNGISTPTEVENIFGNDNTLNWSVLMGKQQAILPF